MTTRKRIPPDSDINPYIAFTDMAFTLVLVVLMLVVLVTVYGRVGWDDIKYRDAQAQMVQAVRKAYQGTAAPQVNEQKNDPPGAQRWVFAQTNLFQPGTAQLTPTGRSTLLRFASVIRNKQELWRRLRIEGHTRPTRSGERDDWLLSSQRAEQVARIFQSAGHVPPYRMAIAGRAGQNPQFRNDLNNPVNERVEFLIEYAQKEQ